MVSMCMWQSFQALEECTAALVGQNGDKVEEHRTVMGQEVCEGFDELPLVHLGASQLHLT